MYKKTINTLLSQEISRKDFLKAGGVIIISLIGIPSLLNTISKAFSGHGRQTSTLGQATGGYGARSYGK